VEARPSEQEVREALARIEAAVSRGDIDLRSLGFWRLVHAVELSEEDADRWADQIARIDGVAFRTAVRLRAPVWLGNALLLGGVLAGALAVAVALTTRSGVLAGLALILAGGIWSVCIHCPAHWAVGRIVGVRFTDYFVGGPFPPRPGLKIDYASYLRSDPSGRATMHASGAIATKLAPFVALAFWPFTVAPWWSAAALLALGVIQIATDILFSVRSSDWKKVRRERAVARARSSRPYTEGTGELGRPG
jgi:hypothetical protein